MRTIPRKARVFWPLLVLFVLADCTTKRLAEEHLTPVHEPHPVVGSVIQLTLAYNPGAATGITLGAWSRVGLTVLTFIVLAALGAMYRRTTPGDRWLALALSLVMGGAIGNLIDRLRSARGVVDFIDIGFGAHRFWVFNLADIGVMTGALLLAVLLWRRDNQPDAAG